MEVSEGTRREDVAENIFSEVEESQTSVEQSETVPEPLTETAAPVEETDPPVPAEPLPETEDLVAEARDQIEATEEPAIEEAVAAEEFHLKDAEQAEGQEEVQTLEEAPEPDPQPKEAVAPHPTPVPAPEPQRNSFWPAVFGGVVAALLGFIAGRGDMLDAYLPRAAAPEPVDLTPLTEETAALTNETVALAARLDQLENTDPVDVSSDLEAMTGGLDALQTSLQGLTARLDTLEAQPAPAAPVPQVDNSEEVAALQSAITALESRLADEDARASVEAGRLLAQAALTRVVTAVENGESFEPALGALEEVAPVEVPDALRNVAAEGVPSMTALRETFPEAARAGLAAARAEVPESEVSGIGGFLRRQLSARSVTPREGNDPDAVLSRVEAALGAGQLEVALTELDALPEAARTAMQGWLDSAQARKDASDAARALSDSLTVN